MKKVILVIFHFFFLSVAGRAQTVAVSQISGTVKDGTGAVLPGAEVKMTQTDTSFSRNALTDETGAYTLLNLPVGPYRLEVAMPGFRTYVQSGIVLQVNSNPAIHVSLEVGALAEKVEVQADVALVETRSTGVGQVIDNVRVVELPLEGRRVTELILLSGTAVVTGGFNGNRNYPTQSISVAGGSGGGTAYILDGADHNDLHNNLNLPLPFPDALQEFKVETSAVPARYGHHASAAVNVVTKTGSNELHGDAFWFVRNSIFNARNSFQAIRDDSLKRNQFGGTLGGPIARDKLFWFGGYQGTTARQDPRTNQTVLPTPAMLAGDFTAAAAPACNAGRPITLAAPFVNNQIDRSLLHPAMVKLASYLPAPSDPCGRYQYGFPNNSDDTQLVGKIDYQKSERHSLFLRYLYAHQTVPVPKVDPLQNALIATFTGTDNKANSLVIGDTYTLRSNIISAFRVTGNWTENYRTRPELFTPADLGLNLLVMDPKEIELSVTGGFGLGGGAANKGKWNMTAFQVSEDIDWIHGPHQIAVGVNFVNGIMNQENHQFSNGSIAFNGQRTNLGLADYLLGLPQSINQARGQRDYERSKYISLYAQDNWKVTNRLSLNYGLRWEPYLPMQHKFGWVNHFEYERFLQARKSTAFVNAPAGLMFPGDEGYPDKGTNRGNKALFAPRFGLVFDPRGKGLEVIRAGYGIFYDLPPMSYNIRLSNTLPYGGQVTLNQPNLSDPWASFPGGNPFPIVLKKDFVFPERGVYYNQPLSLQNTYVQQWNLTVQKQFGADWSVSLSYLGNKTTHMWSEKEANPVVYIPGNSTTANTENRRLLYLLNPAEGRYYSSIVQTDGGGNGTFNGGVVSVQKRFNSRFSLLSNYTLGHCISDQDNDQFLDGVDYINPYNRSQDHASCAQDRRHIMNSSVVMNSPRFNSSMMQKLAGGWQLSFIYRVQSGAPLTVTTGRDAGFLGGNGQRPNLVGNPKVDNPTYEKWFNTAAFVSNGPGEYGNAGRSILRGSSTVTFDIGVTRRFNFHEAQRLEFRAEAFNALNMNRPGNPTTNMNTTNFGRVTSSLDPRILQFAFKYVF